MNQPPCVILASYLSSISLSPASLADFDQQLILDVPLSPGVVVASQPLDDTSFQLDRGPISMYGENTVNEVVPRFQHRTFDVFQKFLESIPLYWRFLHH